MRSLRAIVVAAILAVALWATPLAARTLTVAVPSLPTTMEPMGDNSNRISRVMYSVFETLIRMNQDTGELRPGLAESWRRIDDRTVEFTLRQGVKFHDGQPFSSEDVVFSFGPERFMDEKAPGRVMAGQFLDIVEKVEADGPYKVRVVTKTPDPLIETRFASRMTEIISKKAYLEAGDWDRWSQKPIGTGPYKIVSFALNNKLELGRFDDHWEAQAPVEAVNFIEVPELSSRIAGLRSAEFDIITEVSPDQLPSLESVSGVDILGGPVENIYGLVFDTLSSPALSDKRLRRAIVMAIDRDALVKSLFGGRTEAANSWQFKTFGNLYLPELDKPLYDLEAAKKLISEAGYKGDPIVWKILPGYYTLESTVSQAIEQMLKAAGLNIKLEIKENWDQVEGAAPDRVMGNASYTCYYQDPSGMLWRRMKPSSPWRTRKYFDRPARFDELGTILESTVDASARKQAYREMLEISSDDPVGVPLYVLPMFYAKRSDVNWHVGVKEYMDLSASNLSFKN
ncbi:MAG: ABC transporter substrate-binding protein [Deltaproteobacteria bacterium]|jgi:peptide/nickel transport system substrate-binding protein|nr:ABC transporter substrate-binding protein [Deltaproteobacteria bacterium]